MCLTKQTKSFPSPKQNAHPEPYWNKSTAHATLIPEGREWERRNICFWCWFCFLLPYGEAFACCSKEGTIWNWIAHGTRENIRSCLLSSSFKYLACACLMVANCPALLRLEVLFYQPRLFLWLQVGCYRSCSSASLLPMGRGPKVRGIVGCKKWSQQSLAPFVITLNKCCRPCCERKLWFA